MAFADSKGAILNRKDQHIALGASSKHPDSPHFASNEILLEQLRRKASLESMDMIGGLIGDPKAKAAHEQEKREMEHSFVQAKREIAKLTPAQLKDIADIASAAHDKHFDDLAKIVKGYANKPQEFAALNAGLQLEFQRRGIGAEVAASVGTNEKNEPVASLSLKTHEGTRTTPISGGTEAEEHRIVSRQFSSDGNNPPEKAQWELFGWDVKHEPERHR